MQACGRTPGGWSVNTAYTEAARTAGGDRGTPGGWSVTAAYTEAGRTADGVRGTPGGWSVTAAYKEAARTAGVGQRDTWRMERHRCIHGGG
ncbi:hypothetical protein NDU88_006362 [Pleurodeles waltl]|uniref:MHC class I antigen n=1 Tax=Pleurodeles waltl TaxID=8319 RepID=A0AAV7LF78_PLEWA|nr:hypothetical protein NDU88_006362 [Pleurodeles waltl]